MNSLNSLKITCLLLSNPSLSPRDFRNPDFLDQVQLDFDKNFKDLNFIYKSEKTFNQISPLTRHEFADLSHATADLYLNQLKQLMSNAKINSYKSIKYIKHKKDSNEKSKIKYKAGEIKTIQKTPCNNYSIYKYLLYINMEKIENKEFNIEHLKEKNKDKIELYNRIEGFLGKLYKNEVLLERYLRIMRKKQEEILNKMKLIEYKTGSYQKLNITSYNTNKNKEKIPVKHSYIEIDNTNSLYKVFYKFKTGRKEILDNGKLKEEIIRIPLAVKKAFHGRNLELLNLDKPCYVSITPSGRFKFGTLSKLEKTYEYKSNNIYAGIDLNLRDNFMSISVLDVEKKERIHKIVAHNKEFDDKLILKHKEIRNYQEEFPEKYTEDLGKLRRIKEYKLKEMISRTIKELRELGVTQIVMEDLEFRNHKSNKKIKEIEEKITWLESFHRFPAIKKWMREQCRKYGILVHWTPSEFTSQECSSCGYVEKGNRNGGKFCCKRCAFEMNSDENASINIINRVVEEKVSLKIHNFVEVSTGEYEKSSKRLGHKRLREIVLGISA